MQRNSFGWLLIAAALLTVGCSSRGKTLADLPTLVPNVSIQATTVYLTENAPPPAYRDGIAFPTVDENLRNLEGWRYEVTLEFEGVFVQTARETSASAKATVWWNQIADARRVVVESSGELLQRPEGESFEAVALGPDAWLLREGTCLTNVQDDARTAANISAGALIGGIDRATPTGRRATINAMDAWEYTLNLDDANIPAIRYAADTDVQLTTLSLWVAPDYDAVVQYHAQLELRNARLLLNDLPVNGTLTLQYDLYEVGELPNITVPFGC